MVTEKHQYNPDERIPPGWILEEELEARGISPDDFAEQCDCAPELIRYIIAGESPLEHDMALKFEQLLGTKALIWLGIESKYQAYLRQNPKSAKASGETA